MCTVTFIPTNQGCIITSNRDEKISREKAISPQEYEIDGKKITFPKDPKAGGTWIVHTNNKIVVLLNGAKEKHLAKPFYRKSRGLIVCSACAFYSNAPTSEGTCAIYWLKESKQGQQKMFWHFQV